MLALFAGVLAIGFAPVGAQLAKIGPSAVGFFRVLIALPVLWAIVAGERFSHKKQRQPATAGDFWALMIAGLLFAADIIIWHWSLHFTSVANSTLLANLAPILASACAWWLFRERIGRHFALGMLLAFTGACILLGGSFQLGAKNLLGDGLACCSILFYAAYVLHMKVLRRKFSAAVIIAWSSLVSCTAFFVVGVCMGDSFQPPGFWSWVSLIALALVTHVGGQTLISYALGKLPASVSSAALFLQPVVSAILAWMLLGQSLSWLQSIGGFIAMIGVVVATRKYDAA